MIHPQTQRRLVLPFETEASASDITQGIRGACEADPG